MSNSNNAEQIKFQVEGAYDGKPLQAMVRDLKAAAEMVDKLNAALSTGLPASLRKSQAEMSAVIDKIVPHGRAAGGEKPLAVADIAKAFSQPYERVAEWMRKNIGKAGGYMPRSGPDAMPGLFRSVESAKKAWAQYVEQQMSSITTGTLAALMKGGGGGGGGPVNVNATASGANVKAEVAGQITLVIPAAQIRATVSGEVAAKGVGAPGGGAGGTAVGAGASSTKGGKRRTLGTLPDDLGAGVTATSLLDTGKKQILTVSRREGARRLITEKYDVESKDLLSTTLTDPSAQAALRRFNLLKRQAAAEVSRVQAGLRGRPQPEVLTGMNAAALAAQQRLQGFVGSPDFARLPADVQAEVLEEVSRLGQGYEARGTGYARQGQNAQAKAAAAAEKERLKTAAAKITARWHRDTGAASGDAWGTQAAQVNRYRDLAELFQGGQSQRDLEQRRQQLLVGRLKKGQNPWNTATPAIRLSGVPAEVAHLFKEGEIITGPSHNDIRAKIIQRIDADRIAQGATQQLVSMYPGRYGGKMEHLFQSATGELQSFMGVAGSSLNWEEQERARRAERLKDLRQFRADRRNLAPDTGNAALASRYEGLAWQAQGKLDLVGKGLQGQALGRWVGQQSLLARSDRAAALAAGTAVGDNLRAGMAYHNRLSGALMAAAELAEGQQAEKFYNAALSHWEKADTLAKRIAGLKPPKPSSRAPGGGSPADQQRGLVSHGLSGFTPTGFLKNLGTVTGWGLAANTAMQGFNFVGDSGARAMQIETQTARLGQIFRGVGGTAQQLTNDVLKLAAAEGRSSDEAMESAVQWSRLGLTRKQVNEAVRTSLVAANVAEISASEATEHLSSLMAVYGLRVSELNSALGMLNQTSNTLNVTNKDLLDGLSRSAGVAKQAGMGFAELQGHIAAIVSATGQTGTMAGNAMKSILVSLSDPTVQDQLRTRFGISVADTEGKISMGRLWSGYQGLSPQQQQQVNLLVAGKNQATRFVADMDNYVLAVRKAYEAQLNLNSAEKENVLIKQTLQKQLTGLRSEWDVLVNQTGTAKQDILGGQSVLEVGGRAARTARLGLQLLQDPFKPLAELESMIPGFGWVKRFNAWSDENARSRTKNPGLFARHWEEQMNMIEDLVNPGARWERLLGDAGENAGISAKGRFETAFKLQEIGQGLGSMGSNSRYAQAKVFEGWDLPGGAGPAIAAALRSGDAGKAQALLAEAAQQLRQQGSQDLVNSRATLRARVKILQAQGGPEAEAQVQELLGKRNNIALEEPEYLEPFALARRRGFVRAMDALRGGALGTLFGQQRGGTAYAEEQQRLALDLFTAQAKEDTLKNSALGGSALDNTLRGQMLEEAMRLRQGATGPAGALRLSVARLHDRRGFWDQSARFEAGQYAVGLTPGEQLLGQMNFLQNRQRTPAGNVTDEDATRGLSRANQLYETQRGVLERIVTLTREQKQLTIEIGHENSKALLISSPGERLRRVAVGNLVRSGRLGAAQMMALDPGAASMAFEMMGGDAGYRQRRELAALTNFRTPEEVLASPLLTDEAKAAYRRGDRRLVQRDIAEVRAGRVSQQQIELAEAYARNRAPWAKAQNANSQSAVMAEGLDELDKVARQTAEGFAKVRDSAYDVADALVTLKSFVEDVLNVPRAPSAPPARPRDVNTGYKQSPTGAAATAHAAYSTKMR